MPPNEDNADDEQKHYDNNTAVSSSMDSHHVQLNTASIIEPGDNI